MNVSYRWLRAVAPGLSASAEEVAERLIGRGAPVESVRSLAEGLTGVRVARVEATEPHPQADRLTVCRVAAGEEAFHRVVCGAPNVREGGLYPFAPPGVTLPGGVEIGRTTIRGVESDGMLCSEGELGLGRDHEGILELRGDWEAGTPLAEALGLDDWLLDVEVTTNRPDLLSHVGVAREVAPGGDGGVELPDLPGSRPWDYELLTGDREVEHGGVTIRVEAPELCPRYLGAVIRGVKVGPSPPWLAARLRSVGARPINNVVDATNYVLQELGQPLHAFDLARLTASTVVVRTARSGETIRTLDGEERRLAPEMLAICDAERPVAVAGVMGGEESEVSEGTTDVLLECALFQPASVRATRKSLGMSTDASYRFERGVDPEGMEAALGRAVELIRASAEGAPDPTVLDVRPTEWEAPRVRLRPARVAHLLGVEFTPAEIAELLEPLGFEVGESGDEALTVRVPGFRSWDVTREVDLIEEVARTWGYDRFPAELGPFRPGTVPDHPLFALEERLRDALVAHGYLEALTLAFAPAEEGEVELLNPVSAEEGRLRRDLLPGLLRRVERNFAHGVRDVRLFEIGTVFHVAGEGELPREETRVAVAVSGRRRPPHWSEPEVAVDLWDVKGLLEELGRIALPGGAVAVGGVGGTVLVGAEAFHLAGPEGEMAGWAGRVDERAVDAPAWADPVWALEITLPPVPAAAPPLLMKERPSFPAVERDLALVVEDDLPASRVRDTVRSAGGEHLEEVELFDLYRGTGVPGNARSLAWRMRFRSPDRTLTDAEVDEAMRRIVTRLREDLGVEPRSR